MNSSRWNIAARRRRHHPFIKHDEFGATYWYCRGDLHREDGPAIIYRDGTTSWWLNDENVTRTEWLRQVLKERPLTNHQRELLAALSENWDGTPDLLYKTVTHLGD